MEILAAKHPQDKKNEEPVAPEALAQKLLASGLPEKASHVRFSGKGYLLFWSDNFPSFLREDLPPEGMEIFLGEVASWVVPPDRGTVDRLREMIGESSQGGVVFRVRRRFPFPEGRGGLFFRKMEDGVHFVLVGPQAEEVNSERVLESPFFSGEDPFREDCLVWLTGLDDVFFEEMAVQTLREEIPDSFLSAVDVRSVRVLTGKPHAAENDGETVGPQGTSGLVRWWGTVVEEPESEKQYRIHATIRCGRVLPLLTVSADTRSLGTIGMSGFRKTLARMSARTLEAAQVFSWSPRYRYVDGWREPEGYGKEWAPAVLGHLVAESGEVTLLPVRATRKDLPVVLKKTRPDEPYFWSLAQERLWIALRGMSIEKARALVSPSVASRMSLKVEPPVSLQGFARMSGICIPE
ncbi:MAG: hypothetical protein M1297_06765 [Nitrospirae bacterium]|jgi:hypothetical protein|nr:hypothetical protein [Nitrospirota bacterium]